MTLKGNYTIFVKFVDSSTAKYNDVKEIAVGEGFLVLRTEVSVTLLTVANTKEIKIIDRDKQEG